MLAAYEMATRHLPNVSRSIHKKKAAVMAAVRPRSKRATGTVARLTDKNYVGGATFQRKLASKGFANAQHPARLSGCGGTGYDMSFAQNGLYVATRGANGLYPTITAEVARYASKDHYDRQQAVPATLDESREYFDPGLLMPQNKLVIQYQVRPNQYVVNVQECMPDLGHLLRDELAMLTDYLRQIDAGAPQEAARIMGLRSVMRLRQLPKGQSLSMQEAMAMDSYVVSAALGNCLLEDGMGILFDSARGDVVPMQGYLAGGQNLVLPMHEGVDNRDEPLKVFMWDVATRRLESYPAVEGLDLIHPSKSL